MHEEMKRVNRILKHPEFLPCIRDIEERERDRIFCGHGMNHLMAVARLAYIEKLETGNTVSKEKIYAAALLHDLGRGQEYRTGVDHHRAGLAKAGYLLRETGFSREETEEILEAIAAHGDCAMKQETGLKGLLYRADKKSRRCWDCPAVTECDWKFDKRNANLEV